MRINVVPNAPAARQGPWSAATLARVASDFAAPTAPATKLKNFLDNTIANVNSNQAPAWNFMLKYASAPSSSATYGNFVTQAGTFWTGGGSDAPGVVGSVDSWIDSENTTAAAYTGSNALPEWASDAFYNTRSVYPDVCLAYYYGKANGLLTSTQKTKWQTYMDNALTQVNSASPVVNGHAVTASYAWKNGDGILPADNYLYGHVLAFMLADVCFGTDLPGHATWHDVWRNQIYASNIKPWMVSTQGCATLEGTGYGAAQFYLWWFFYFVLQATGENLYNDNPSFWAANLKAWGHMVTPDLKYLMNYGDHARESTSSMFDYERMMWMLIMQQFPTATISQTMKNLLDNAFSPYDGSALNTMVHDSNVAFEVQTPINGVITSGSVANLGTYYDDPVGGYVDFRTGWTSTDTAVFHSYACKTQGHDHADKGSVAIYKGTWLIYDQNINTHSGEDMDPDVVNFVALLSGTTLQSQLYSLTGGTAPTKLFSEDGTIGYFYSSVDFSSVWGSPATTVKRDIIFFPKSANGTLVIYDHVVSSSALNKRLQFNTPYVPTLSTTSFSNDTASIAANSSITCKLQLIESGSVGFSVGSAWNAGNSNPASGDMTQNYTGGSLTGGRRLDCQQTSNTADFLTVIDVNGSLSSAASAGTHAVTLNFADSTTKTVTFFTTATHATVV